MKRLIFMVAWLLSAVAAQAQIIPPTFGINAVSSGVTVCTSLNCATWNVPATAPSLTTQITGTMTSMTLTAEGTTDGLTWFTMSVVKLSDGSLVSTTTTTGQFAFANTGLVGFRWRCTTYSSGGANVSLTRGAASSTMKLSPGFTGSFAAGSIATATSSNVLTGLADVAVGQVLASGGVGVVPAYTANPVVSTLTTGGGTKFSGATNGLLTIAQTSGATVALELNPGTALPTVANCSVGSAGSISSHSTNTGGEVNLGSGSTSCDVVFGAPPWSFAPFCTITNETSVILAARISARTTLLFTITGATAGDKFTYTCVGGAI